MPLNCHVLARQKCLSTIAMATVICSIFLLLNFFIVNQPAKLASVAIVTHPKSHHGKDWWLKLWPVRLAANLLSYAFVLALLYCLNRFANKCKYFCAFNANQVPISFSTTGHISEVLPSSTVKPSCLKLTVCFVSLQLAFVTWGVLQERVMTAHYSGEKFTDSQFMVFSNRVLSGIVALCLIMCSRSGICRRSSAGDEKLATMSTASPVVPLLDFAYCSLSNVLSAWCQYEALVYVNFPTQVLAKACKIVPVMLMGKLVSQRSFRSDEYVTAGVVSAGSSIFLVASTMNLHHDDYHQQQHQQQLQQLSPSSASDSASVNLSALNGCALLAGYLVFDSFTSTWQGRMFCRHRQLSPLELMAGTNLLSSLLTLTSQLQQGSLPVAVSFASDHPAFLFDVAMLSVCSAAGQLAIFYTIQQFGPVTFVIIMTVRQGLSILLSCLLYRHPIGSIGWFGLALVFSALLGRIWLDRRVNKG